MGLDNTLYWSLTRAANQSTYIMAGSPPPTFPNGTNIFTPEFKVTFVNADTTSVGVCEFFFEVDMVIETRGSRFMNTV